MAMAYALQHNKPAAARKPNENKHEPVERHGSRASATTHAAPVPETETARSAHARPAGRPYFQRLLLLRAAHISISVVVLLFIRSSSRISSRISISISISISGHYEQYGIIIMISSSSSSRSNNATRSTGEAVRRHAVAAADIVMTVRNARRATATKGNNA
jgi:hypothetical protein